MTGAATVLCADDIAGAIDEPPGMPDGSVDREQSAMIGRERRAMSDADQCCLWQHAGEHAIKRLLLCIVGGRRSSSRNSQSGLNRRARATARRCCSPRTTPAPNAPLRPGASPNWTTRPHPRRPTPRLHAQAPEWRETTALDARSRSACRAAAAGTAFWRRREGEYSRWRTAIIPRERETACSCRSPNSLSAGPVVWVEAHRYRGEQRRSIR